MLALAVYGVLGVFGHALHGLLPCADEACGTSIVSSDHCGCGCHALEQTAQVTGSEGPEVRGDAHDSDTCSLCAVLAQIKVSRAAIFTADLTVAQSFQDAARFASLHAAELLLTRDARGPPAC
jgi:hypothetical protein